MIRPQVVQTTMPSDSASRSPSAGQNHLTPQRTFAGAASEGSASATIARKADVAFSDSPAPVREQTASSSSDIGAPQRVQNTPTVFPTRPEVPFGLPRTCFAVSVEDDVAAEVTGPTGRQYVITVSAPHPQAASDGPTGGNLIGLLQLIVRAGREVASHRWRIVVRERTPTGDLGRTLHESSANSLEEARARFHDLERLIRA